MPSPRFGCCGVLFGDKWYIIGGDGKKTRCSETLIFDVAKITWFYVVTSPSISVVSNQGFNVVLIQRRGRDMSIFPRATRTSCVFFTLLRSSKGTVLADASRNHLLCAISHPVVRYLCQQCVRSHSSRSQLYLLATTKFHKKGSNFSNLAFCSKLIFIPAELLKPILLYSNYWVKSNL